MRPPGNQRPAFIIRTLDFTSDEMKLLEGLGEEFGRDLAIMDPFLRAWQRTQ